MSLPNELHPLQLGAGSAAAYEIEQSLRFNSADSAYLTRTVSTNGNGRTFTISLWFKKGGKGGVRHAFYGAGDTANPSVGGFWFRVDIQERLWAEGGGGTTISVSSADLFRDHSAWYHFVCAVDTTQSTSSNRVKLYVNGQQISSFNSTSYPSQNYQFDVNLTNASQQIGRANDANTFAYYVDGYVAEYHLLDGTQASASDFGEYNNNGVWVPKEYTGSYGTNGFYLKFDPTATNSIGHDHSGNGNNWTPSGFSTSGTGTDVMSDTPTTNWCTLNPIYSPATSSNVPRNGNLEVVAAGGGYDQVHIGTQAFTSGKWYWEYKMEGANNYGGAGIIDPTTTAFHDMMRSTTPSLPLTGGFQRRQGGTVSSPGVTNVSSGAISNGDVAMFAVDYDSGKVWVGTSGTWYNSGDPAAGTNPTITIQTLTTAVPFFSPTDSGSQTYYINWGQRDFEYTPPTGFLPLNTANLPAPTVKDGSKNFNTVLYAGNQTSQSITGFGFQPDWVWVKKRNGFQDHEIQDAVRGATKSISSSLSNAETTDSQSITSFTSDGFDIGSSNSVNENRNYVAWAWKANGSGSSNTDGTITSTVSANPSAGFSIISFTGTGNAGSIGHGLGVKPGFVIGKDRDRAVEWKIYFPILGNYVEFTTAAQSSVSNAFTGATSSVLNLQGSGYGLNYSGDKSIVYCFAEVEGYSKFGSYTGNGSLDGPFVYCGFKPAWLIIKRTDGTGEWFIVDTPRNPYNAADDDLFANANTVETASSGKDLLSNGFKIRENGASMNASGGNFVFAAFAENPFGGGSRISPATAR